jgi:hypothetical protein
MFQFKEKKLFNWFYSEIFTDFFTEIITNLTMSWNRATAIIV